MADVASTSPVARLLHATARVEAHEIKAALLSFLLFFLILGSYYIIRPVREMLGTVYGVENLAQLFTATSICSLAASPIFAAFASRIRLSIFLPSVYGVVMVTLIGFYGLFTTVAQDHWVAGAFYVWISVFNLLITSVFWSLMADMFSRAQAKRLFGFISAGGSLGAIAGPALTALLAERMGTNALLLYSAAGFGLTIAVLFVLEREKTRVADHDSREPPTTLQHELGGDLFDGFKNLARSPYLLLIAGFVVLLSWISTVVYFQQVQLITQAFESREARTRAFALVDLAVNVGAILVQLFGTMRITQRFGVTATLMLAPIIMFAGLVLSILSPTLIVLLGVQVVRRTSEYAITKPGREILFTVLDQESKYKSKNVIDTVVARLGDMSSAWLASGLKALGADQTGFAASGAVGCIIWAWLGLILGRRHEAMKSAT